jgi:squalene-associated FAD-dependent desaturase
VFVDGFLRHRDGFVVHVPMVPLGRLYGEELRAWFASRGVEIRENAAAKQLHVENGRITEVTLRDNSTLDADQYVLAVPHDRVADLLPPAATNGEPYFEKITRLETSPITSVHLWFDRSVMSLPHAVLVDCLGHWVFNRGEIAKGEFYLQVVISASQSLRNWGRDEILQRIVEELNQLFPDARCASLLRSRVVTEHRATFSAVPGVDALRPTQASPISNLVLAGDYTATNWPATMEGAVRSGYLAAEVIVARGGRPERILRPDLA